MTSKRFLIGNAAGFSGDRVDAALPVVRTLISRGLPSALFFEVLGERTVALAQMARACAWFRAMASTATTLTPTSSAVLASASRWPNTR